MPRTPSHRTPRYCTPLARSAAPRSAFSGRRATLINLGLASSIAVAAALGGVASGGSAGPQAEPSLALSSVSSAEVTADLTSGLDTQIGLARRHAADLRAGAARRHLVEQATARRTEQAAAAARTRLVAQAQRASRSRRAALLASDPRDIARAMLADRGEAGQFGCLDSLWTRESGWRVHDTNPSSGAYGIPQSLPAGKMASAGADWRDNPATQIRWGLGYIDGRYGSPCTAWAHSQAFNWY